MDFARALGPLVSQFNERSIPHAVIGGIALAMWGIPRTTLDLDLVVDGDRQEEVLGIVAALGYELLHRSTGYSNHLHPDLELGQVDFVYVRGETRTQLFQAATSRPGPGGLTAPVASAKHLAAMKAWAVRNDPSRRDQDLADIRSLAAVEPSPEIREILERLESES
jgi:hypothetical protein